MSHMTGFLKAFTNTPPLSPICVIYVSTQEQRRAAVSSKCRDVDLALASEDTVHGQSSEQSSKEP